MSNIPSEIERFGKDLAADEALLDELKKVGTDHAAIVAFANAKGYQFTVEDVKGLENLASYELSEEELEKVAGGIWTVIGGGVHMILGDNNFFLWW